MYSQKVLDHFRNPKNVGKMDNPDGIGKVGNPVCGDVMVMYLKINPEEIIEDAKFETFGCGAAIATSSIATELIKGKSIQDAQQVTNQAVVSALDGLPPAKMHCSVLAEEAVKKAIEDYQNKKSGHTPPAHNE